MKTRLLILFFPVVLLVPEVLQARWLNTDTGRFTTMDTFPGNRQDPMSLHKYVYVQNNPVNCSDPTGLMLYKCCGDASELEFQLVGAQHAYVYDDTVNEIYEMDGDCNPADWYYANYGISYGTIHPGDKDRLPGSPRVFWAYVPNSTGREAAVRASVGQYPRAVWKPGINDCWTFVSWILKQNGLEDPPLQVGRFSQYEIRDNFVNASVAGFGFAVDDPMGVP